MLSLFVIDRPEVLAAGDDTGTPATTPEPKRGESSDTFAGFVEMTGARLRVALVARYGVDQGVEACADALAYAWEHWPRVSSMANPGGYLFRVGQTSARRQRHRAGRVILPPENGAPEAGGREPGVLDIHDDGGLHLLLAGLDDRQRTAVVLAHVYGWTYSEIADLLDVRVGTVRNLIHRGMTKLRQKLEP